MTKLGPAEVTLPAVMPVPEMVTLTSGVKFAPRTVTPIVCVNAANAGTTLEAVGCGGAVIEKLTGALLQRRLYCAQVDESSSLHNMCYRH